MKGFPFRIFAPLVVFLLGAVLVASSAKHEIEQKDVVEGRAAQIVIGKSTWKDVERVFGRKYFVTEPKEKDRRQKVWLMDYPMLRQDEHDVIFVINRETGIVEEQLIELLESDFGRRLFQGGWYESDLVRRLVTEFHAPYCLKDHPWRTPEYKGIVVGKSKRVDVEASFGKADSVSECGSEERNFSSLEYSRLSGFDGRVIFSVNCSSSVVEGVFLQPSPPWPLEKALATYGDGYCYRRYFIREDPQLGELSEYGPLEESPRGNLVQIEYRSLAVVLHLDDTWHRIYLIVYELHREMRRGNQ